MRENRERLSRWARGVLESGNIVFLDTETTGVSPESGDEAVSIGISDKEEKILLDVLVPHRRESSLKALETHGISWEMTRTAPPFFETLGEVRRLTLGRSVVSYCTKNFDANILISSCIAHGCRTLDLRRLTIQLLEPFSEFYGAWNRRHGNYRWQSLVSAAEFFGESAAGAHGAAVDAVLASKVLRGMAEWGEGEG